MRWKTFAAIVVVALSAGPAVAGYAHLVGNDTGGIIPWSPDIEPLAYSIAAEHCARYYKRPRITSIHRQYGDYIGFRCIFPQGHDWVAKRGWY